MTSKTKRRSLRKVPAFIDAALPSISHDFQIAVVQRIPLADVKNGAYNHLGLSFTRGQLTVEHPRVPAPELSRHANFNVHGQEVVRRDLPKVEKTIRFVNTCLFGVPGNTCVITQTRLVYQREQIPPRHHEIECQVLLVNEEQGACFVKFGIPKMFSRNMPNFDRELLFALNLLRQTAGGVNVFGADATAREFLGSIHVDWEILPAGERDNNIRIILSSFRPRTEEEKAELEERAQERYDFFESLKPLHIVRGTGGMNGYMGAVINEEVVVFEHLAPGNGVYILFADWRKQSQRTKTDLLTHGKEGKDYIRITHSGDWQMRVRNEIASRVH